MFSQTLQVLPTQRAVPIAYPILHPFGIQEPLHSTIVPHIIALVSLVSHFVPQLQHTLLSALLRLCRKLFCFGPLLLDLSCVLQ